MSRPRRKKFLQWVLLVCGAISTVSGAVDGVEKIAKLLAPKAAHVAYTDRHAVRMVMIPMDSRVHHRTLAQRAVSLARDALGQLAKTWWIPGLALGVLFLVTHAFTKKERGS
jgi:hypothetical protein